jgi:uncharacterized protein (UPF0261 family)
MKTVAIVTTCDTKGREAQYLKKSIEKHGIYGWVIDCGILNDPIGVIPDTSRHKVAQAAGYTIDELIARGSRGAAVNGMIEGINSIITSMSNEGKVDALIAMGGAEGALIAKSAMDALPLFVPKLTMSTIASGEHKFGEIIGHNDAMVMHTVIDILGINSISKKIFDNGINAIVGMLEFQINNEISNCKRVAMTMLGTITPPIVKVVQPLFEKERYEVYTFHANGIGGECMDKLAEEKYFDGVFDWALNEIVGLNFGGLHKCGKQRMEAAIKKGIPLVVVPGAADIIVLSTEDASDQKYSKRAKYYHNKEITLAALSVEECIKVAETIVDKLNEATGQVEVLFPLKGLCSQDKEGKSLYNPKGTKAMVKIFKEKLKKDIGFVVCDNHINDDEFAMKAANKMIKLIKESEVIL